MMTEAERHKTDMEGINEDEEEDYDEEDEEGEEDGNDRG